MKNLLTNDFPLDVEFFTHTSEHVEPSLTADIGLYCIAWLFSGKQQGIIASLHKAPQFSGAVDRVGHSQDHVSNGYDNHRTNIHIHT